MHNFCLHTVWKIEAKDPCKMISFSNEFYWGSCLFTHKKKYWTATKASIVSLHMMFSFLHWFNDEWTNTQNFDFLWLYRATFLMNFPSTRQWQGKICNAGVALSESPDSPDAGRVKTCDLTKFTKISSYTKVDLNSVNHPKVSQHLGGAYDQSKTCTSLLAAGWHIPQSKRVVPLHRCTIYLRGIGSRSSSGSQWHGTNTQQS